LLHVIQERQITNVVSTKSQQLQLQVIVKPTSDVPLTYLYTPLNYGYSIALYETSGKEITDKFSKNVAVSLRYVGTNSSLQAGYLTTDAWRTDSTSTHDETANQITVHASRAGTYALLTANTVANTATSNSHYLPIIVK